MPGDLLSGFGEVLPEDRDAEIVSSCDVRSLDVVTEQDQSDEQVVDVGFVNRKEDHGHVLLQRQGSDFKAQNPFEVS